MTTEPPENRDIVQEAREHADQFWPTPRLHIESNPDAPDYRLDIEASTLPPLDDYAEQASFLAGAPEWALIHPGSAEMANATWREADEVRPLVDRLLKWDELKALRDVTFDVRWRTKSKPTRRTRTDEEIILAGVDIVPARYVWEAALHGMEDFPRLLIDLYWGHWEDRRKNGVDGNRYIHHKEVERAIHHALMGLVMQGAEIKKIGPDVMGFAATVQRFGAATRGIRAMRRQLRLLPDDSDDEEEGRSDG